MNEKKNKRLCTRMPSMVAEREQQECLPQKRQKAEATEERGDGGAAAKQSQAPAGDPPHAEDRELVRQTLKIFDTLRRKIQRNDGDEGSAALKAAALMKEKKLWIDRVNKIGDLPGLKVGDHFYFAAELCVVGLHRQIGGGVDEICGKDSEWGHPVAASVVFPAGYGDDGDDAETLIYTDPAGSNRKEDQEDQNLKGGDLALENSCRLGLPVRVIRVYTDRSTPSGRISTYDAAGSNRKEDQEDQNLKGGDLALENSCRLGLPVRVIRVCTDRSSPSGRIYTYDGLYLVEESWLEGGVYGIGVCRFKLRRIPGQPPLGSAIARFASSLKAKLSKREGVVMDDISGGLEPIRVCVVNEIDDTVPELENFQYIIRVSFPKSFVDPPPDDGCSCENSCSSAGVCICVRKNGGEAPYVDGLLVDPKTVVYECGFQCGCLADCPNRVTQNGIKHWLEVFKTKQKGWGVRSLDSIPSGSFICEYIGELIDSDEAEHRIENDDYLFDLHLIKENKAPDIGASISSHEALEDANGEDDETSFSLDAKNYGNVGRFINHSCFPNLFAQFVIFDHDDLRIPHIMFFAIENIPPLTELTYDYGYPVGEAIDSNGNAKVKICHCGEQICKGRMY